MDTATEAKTTADSAKSTADAAMSTADEAKTILDATLREGIYSGEITVNNDSEQQTDTFWDQLFAVYNAMPTKSVKYIYAKIISDYSKSDPNEPIVGSYRVIII